MVVGGQALNFAINVFIPPGFTLMEPTSQVRAAAIISAAIISAGVVGAPSEFSQTLHLELPKNHSCEDI